MSSRRPSNPAPAAPVEGGFAAAVLDLLEVRCSDQVPAWLARHWEADLGSPGSRTLRIHSAQAARVKAVEGGAAFSVAEVGGAPAPAAADAPLTDLVHSRHALWSGGGETGARVLAAFEAGNEVRFVVELRSAMRRPGAQDVALLEAARRYFERLVEGETDTLTRLANRRLFQWRFDAGFKDGTDEGRVHHFAMMDIDHFKRVNDNFGHLYGDEILVHFSSLMRRTFRAGDQLYRFGGEEFVVMYSVAAAGDGGAATLERFRKAVEAYDFPGVGRITVSIGHTRIVGATPSAMLIDNADAALYFAKAHGRNRVCEWDALVASGDIVPRASPKPDVTLF